MLFKIRAVMQAEAKFIEIQSLFPFVPNGRKEVKTQKTYFFEAFSDFEAFSEEEVETKITDYFAKGVSPVVLEPRNLWLRGKKVLSGYSYYPPSSIERIDVLEVQE